MALSPPFRRLRRLGAANVRLLGEALPALVLASAAIRLIPFKRLAARASRPGRRGAVPEEAFLRKLAWSVDAWGARVPWRALCCVAGEPHRCSTTGSPATRPGGFPPTSG
jgi:hypothetical protein